MDLSLYLSERRLTQKEFAKLIEISPVTLNNILRGKRKPTIQTLKRIHIATKGRVGIKDFLKDLD